MSDRQWLLRIIVLESVAGVPGMVGGTLRHLRSLRLLVSLHLFLEERERRLMNREEMVDGSILYWKKQRTRECTSCKFPHHRSYPVEGQTDRQDILDGGSTDSLDTSTSSGRPGSHVQPLLLDVPDLFEDGTSIRWRS